MRLFKRAIATTVAGLAFAAAGVAGATPAAASPQDGKGCIGLPSVPDTYLCVISLTPENAVPTVTTTPVYVTVPKVCYFLDCTAATTHAVPVPGITANSGLVAVLWYKGQYIPVAVGTATVMKAVTDAVNLGTQVLNGTVMPAVNGALVTVNDVINWLPTTEELIDSVRESVAGIRCWLNQLLDPYYYCWY